MEVIVHIKHHTTVYFDAIDMSIKVSEEGVSFAKDAFALCRLLSQNKPVESLVAFLDDMIDLASKAHRNAQSTVDKFRSARQGLLRVIIYCFIYIRLMLTRAMSGHRSHGPVGRYNSARRYLRRKIEA